MCSHHNRLYLSRPQRSNDLNKQVAVSAASKFQMGQNPGFPIHYCRTSTTETVDVGRLHHKQSKVDRIVRDRYYSTVLLTHHDIDARS
jgi:hypothetical protein